MYVRFLAGEVVNAAGMQGVHACKRMLRENFKACGLTRSQVAQMRSSHLIRSKDRLW
jgi:hypothetical protein